MNPPFRRPYVHAVADRLSELGDHPPLPEPALTTAETIAELAALAKDLRESGERGVALGLRNEAAVLELGGEMLKAIAQQLVSLATAIRPTARSLRSASSSSRLSFWQGQRDGGLGMSDFLTQRVTAKDIEAGQIRLPITNNAKLAFPSVRGDVRVRLRGRELVVSYDPRLGPDRERSGVLRIGRATMARRIVHVDDRLTIVPGDPVSLDKGGAAPQPRHDMDYRCWGQR